MRTRLICHLVLFVILSMPAMAQETWGGLRFGMTEQEALIALKGRSVGDIKKNKGAQPYQDNSWYAAFRVTDVVVNELRGSADLRFNSLAKTLQMVAVNLEGLAYLDRPIRAASTKGIEQSLAQKYGTPKQERKCGPVGGAIYCTTVWENASQEIRLILQSTQETPGTASHEMEDWQKVSITYSLLHKPDVL